MKTTSMPRKRLAVLGSTGSIGTQTLEIADHLGFPVAALAAGRSVSELEEQIRRYRPAVAALYDEQAAADLRVQVADTPTRVLSGMEGLCAVAAMADLPDCPDADDMVVNAVVGMVGLRPTLTAVDAGKDVALANKETLVAGGELVMKQIRQKGIRLLPVDSEHSAIFQCLQGAPPDRAIRRLILTASGGPFFGRTAAELEQVTLEQALRHPNWSMGAKITIDSATMMNKGLEIIEARWLFDMPEERIDVVIHRQSVVHSLVEYDDRSVLAQMGQADMRIPIQYALTWPYRTVSPVAPLDLAAWGTLTFFDPDDKAFPAMGICREALRRGGVATAAVNAANEQAVALFRQGAIGFADISRRVASVLERDWPREATLETILAADEEARRHVLEGNG
ncbi:MAG: 1-deoxy-D-xylulose-5-phosphate reductoisomerase [Acutalibacteraceae bacterium]|jgi:1-deoxy-D-xylulose-5-phosphate reductoisomerase